MAPPSSETFQSSPAFTGGRFACPKGWRNETDVSILARLYRRALPGSLAARGSLRRRFNPRPPLQAGASVRVNPPPNSGVVSILARLYRRALRVGMALLDQFGRVSILARLYRRALQSLGPQGHSGTTRFQSSPAFTGGRFVRVDACARHFRRRFNPRPPLQAGASSRATGSQWHHEVSILARLYRRALRSRARCSPRRRLAFQSSPAFTGGRFSHLH